MVRLRHRVLTDDPIYGVKIVGALVVVEALLYLQLLLSWFSSATGAIPRSQAHTRSRASRKPSPRLAIGSFLGLADRLNPNLTDAGHNFRLILRWLRRLLRQVLAALIRHLTPQSALDPAS